LKWISQSNGEYYRYDKHPLIEFFAPAIRDWDATPCWNVLSRTVLRILIRLNSITLHPTISALNLFIFFSVRN
jgi:hypothetical protein